LQFFVVKHFEVAEYFLASNKWSHCTMYIWNHLCNATTITNTSKNL